MSFSEIKFTGTLQKSGAIRLPKIVDAGIFVEVAIPGANVTALSKVLGDKNGPYINTPRALRRFVETPLRAEFVVRKSEHEPEAVTLLPDRELRYVVEAFYNKSFSLAVPLTWIRGIQIRGWRDVAVDVTGETIRCSFPDQLNVNKGGQLLVIVPSPLVGALQHKDKVTVTIRPRAPAPDIGGAFVENDQLHWGRADTKTPRMIERGFAVPVSSWMSTKWAANTSISDDVAWLLGFYQAEGNKSVPVFSVPQKSPWLHKKTIAILRDVFRIPTVDLKMEVRYGEQGKEHAVRIYKDCGVMIANVRPSTATPGKEHKHFATLELRNSGPFAEAFQWGLKRIVTRQEELPRAARESFLHGFLDGDGTVTLQSATVLRAAASTDAERDYIASICDEVFERGANGTVTQHVSTNQRAYERSLSVRDMLWLIEKGVFAEGMSRPRLFHRLHQVLDAPPPGKGGDARRGLIDRDACAAELAKYDDEWDYIQSIYPTVESVTTGVKGVLYHYPGPLAGRSDTC